MPKQKTPLSTSAKAAAKQMKKVVATNVTSLDAVKKANLKAVKKTVKAAKRVQKTVQAQQEKLTSDTGYNSYAFAMPSQAAQSFSTPNFFQPFTSQLNTTMERMMTKSPLNYEQFAQQAADQSKQTVEAAVQSANIWANGFEEVLKTYMGFMQENTARQTEAFKTLMSCKTINELTEAQNQLAQRAYDGLVTSATRLSEISTKVATDSLQPLNEQVAKTMKKASAA
ncbi:MAG: phasin family protein [Pseudomonadota bacterium]